LCQTGINIRSPYAENGIQISENFTANLPSASSTTAD